MLVVVSGLPGTGKTTLARELARVVGAPHVRIDTLEAALGTHRGGADDDGGYRLAHAVAGDALRSGRHAVVDAVNPVRDARDAWRALAAEVGVPLLEVDAAATTPLAAAVHDLAARVARHPEQVATPASLLAPTHRLGGPGEQGRAGEVVLETERLLLRRWREADLEPFAAMGADPLVMEHFPSLLDQAASDGLARNADACFEVYGFGLAAPGWPQPSTRRGSGCPGWSATSPRRTRGRSPWQRGWACAARARRPGATPTSSSSPPLPRDRAGQSRGHRVEDSTRAASRCARSLRVRSREPASFAAMCSPTVTAG